MGGGWLEDGIASDTEIALWLETPISNMIKSERRMFPVMMRSSLWPRLWVGPCTCCVRFSESRWDRKSAAMEHFGESTCRLKSPSIRMLERVGHTEDMKLKNSGMKDQLYFGGR